MLINDPEYQEHTIFQDLDTYYEFYKDLSFGVSKFVTFGTVAIGNIDTQIFAAMGGTIDSIRALLRIGRINDAYSLLRKFHDTAIINIYSTLYLSDHFSMENFIVEKINNWLQGTESLPDYRVMSQYIGESPLVKSLTSFFYKDKYYKGLRDRCNNYVHFNFYRFTLYNNNEIYLPGRINELSQLKVDLKNLFILHVAYVFFLNPPYLCSSDISDYLDLGLSLEPGMENEVAPYIQEVFDKVIKRHRRDIANVILSNTPMNLR